MALIKNAQSARLVKDAIVLDMGDLGRQAKRILDAAREEGGKIIEHGRAEAQRLIANADSRGHEEGFCRGMQEGRERGTQEGREQALREWQARFDELTQRWTAALNAWESERAAMLHEARADVIRFAAALARKVVNRLVQADPSVIQDQLAQALMLVAKPTSIEVVVHPADRALVEQVLPALAQQIAGCAHCAIREDPSISAGGCVIATAAGRVDATIETQLARIAEALVPDPTPAALNAGDGAALS